MHADQALGRPQSGGTLNALTLVAALLALALAGAALWRTTMPMWGFAPAATATAPGYGPGMMPWGGGSGMMPGNGYGPGMMGPNGGMGMGMMMGNGGVALQQAVAGALSISLDELLAAERAGQSVATLAQEKGIDLQQVVDAAMAPHKAAMTVMTDAGYMTQPQYDWMIKAMEDGLRAQFAAVPYRTPDTMPMPGNGMMGPGYGMGQGYGYGPGMR